MNTEMWYFNPSVISIRFRRTKRFFHWKPTHVAELFIWAVLFAFQIQFTDFFRVILDKQLKFNVRCHRNRYIKTMKNNDQKKPSILSWKQAVAYYKQCWGSYWTIYKTTRVAVLLTKKSKEGISAIPSVVVVVFFFKAIVQRCLFFTCQANCGGLYTTNT